jgi:glutathione S-transferase
MVPLPRITGRSSSHYTRLARMFAHELGVACEFAPVYVLASLDERSYAGNPALKLPVLGHGGTVVFGAENICRTLAEVAPRHAVILWPENLRDAPARNALAWLDERVPPIIAALPPHDLSLLEVSLFCLLEHLAFRPTVPLAPYARLGGFARAFAQRASAQATPYRFDAPAGD